MPSRFQALAPAITTRLSTVVKALDTDTQRSVAVKRALHREDTALAREAELLRQLQPHPHWIEWLAAGQDEQGYYLATAWHPGCTLDDCLSLRSRAARGLPLPEWRAVIEAVLLAVQRLHQLGNAHGDLTAANVMLCPEAECLSSIQLIDLGNATALNGQATAASTAPRGSIYSMAPELFDGHACDASTDLYALGVMAYLGLTGELPFQGDIKPQVIAAHCQHWRRPVRELRPEVPVEWEVWVEALTSPQRQARPVSVAEALLEWQALPRG